MWSWIWLIGVAVWIFFDAKKRGMKNFGGYAVGAVGLGIVAIPLYFAKRNLYTGEVREGGTAWNFIKVFALCWTVVILLVSLVGFGEASQTIAQETSVAAQAGGVVGTMLGMGLLIGLWFAVLVSTLVIGLFLRKSSVVENGPTGELASQETSEKKLGVWMLVVWVLIACASALVTSGTKENDDTPKQTLASVSKLDELAVVSATTLSPTGELAAMFNLMSDNTDLQRENKLKEIKGKVVEWSLTVYEVEKDGDGYTVQTKAGNDVGTFIHISPRNAQDKATIEALKTGSRISIKGIIKDDLMRNLVIKPAILFEPHVSELATEQITQVTNSEIVGAREPKEPMTQQNSGVCAEIYRQEELNPGDNNVMCSNLEFEIADKELNSTYKTVMAGLALDRKSVLKSEQIKWIKVKEKQCDEATAGTINFRQETLSRNQCLIEMTTQRSAYLKAFDR